MITFALLAPSQSEVETVANFEPIQEILKNIVGLLDIFAIYYAMNYLKSGGGETVMYKASAITLGML